MGLFLIETLAEAKIANTLPKSKFSVADLVKDQLFQLRNSGSPVVE